MVGDVVKVGVIVLVLAALWVLSDADLCRRLGRALRLVEPDPPAPSGLPIERIAADARRIRNQLRHVPPGTPAARLRGWQAAYDDVLVLACRALGLEHRLEELAPGPVRELERQRVERMLEAAGLLPRSAA